MKRLALIREQRRLDAVQVAICGLAGTAGAGGAWGWPAGAIWFSLYFSLDAYLRRR